MVNNFYDAHTLTTKVEHVAQIKLETNHCFPDFFFIVLQSPKLLRINSFTSVLKTFHHIKYVTIVAAESLYSEQLNRFCW